MKTIRNVLLLILFSPSLTFAAQIYGTLKEGDKFVGGVTVAVECAGGSDSKGTDARGSYNLYVKQTGKCTFKVLYQGQWSQPFTIYSYDEPVRYDFDLVRLDNGQYALKRR